MTGDAPKSKIPKGTPETVRVTMQTPTGATDSSLGIRVVGSRAAAKHPLVTLGDSLTHGFQSAAIFNTDLSWAALVARAGGYYGSFRRPHYDKYGGLPLNLEYLQRELESKYPPPITVARIVEALFFLRGEMADICHYWQDGDGAVVPRNSLINHDLATFGFDLRDAMSLTPAYIKTLIAGTHENLLLPLVTHGKERAALRTLPYFDPGDPGTRAMTCIEAARALGDDGGIDTLVVILGANNVLGITMDLCLRWSGDNYDDLTGKQDYNIWRPEHFAAEFAEMASMIADVNARRVIVATVPHVTVAPLLHGIGGKVIDPDESTSRYFRYYSRPWFDESDFLPGRIPPPHLTENDVRTVDSVIDQYNETIVATVQAARNAGRDWHLFDLRWLLDRLAVRRYIEWPPSLLPLNWTPYPLPPTLAGLNPVPDTRFWQSNASGRLQGGIVALDGIHPTTVGYGIMAQEIINVMKSAGVDVADIDFDWLLGQDTLMSNPPTGFDASFEALKWLDERVEFFRHLFSPGSTTKC